MTSRDLVEISIRRERRNTVLPRDLTEENTTNRKQRVLTDGRRFREESTIATSDNLRVDPIHDVGDHSAIMLIDCGATPRTSHKTCDFLI